MVRSKLQLLSAGVSLLALGIVAPGVAQAQSDQFQQTNGHKDDNDTPNLYTVTADTTTGMIYFDVGNANANVNSYVTCAVIGDGDCDTEGLVGDGGNFPNTVPVFGVDAFPGSILQTESSDNTVDIDAGADLLIQANAGAFANTEAVAHASFLEEAMGVQQHGVGEEATNLINIDSDVNGGSLNVLASAVAGGNVGNVAEDADATARISEGGVYQSISDEGTEAFNHIVNNGGMDVTAFAQANAGTPAGGGTEGEADAYAAITEWAIAQYALAEDADNVIDNNSSMSVHVTANAVGSTEASAYAFLGIGIGQLAFGGSQALGDINNEGTIDIQVHARATGTTAFALATIGRNREFLNYEAIGQRAYAVSEEGVGSVSLNNTGAIDIDAQAFASANENDAFAVAYLQTGIYHDVSGGDSGSADLTNSSTGTITINSGAHAVVVNDEAGGDAIAHADMYIGIQQNARAFFATEEDSNTASVAIDNDGLISIGVDATATAEELSALAAAYLYAGIYQDAGAGNGTDGNAAAAIDNSGTIIIGVDADAKGLTEAFAIGYAGYGIYQSAYAQGSEDADATATINNTGLISVAVTANASTGLIAIDDSGTVDVIIRPDADARAGIKYGIDQTASAVATEFVADEEYTGSATAHALLDNGGTISIIAQAQATGVDAYAFAYIDPGIFSGANAIGGALANATADLPNTGSIGIYALATAHGVLTANADATIDYGISQAAHAVALDVPGGVANANATLDNSGSITIMAAAKATALAVVTVNETSFDLGEAQALASMETGIYQSASAEAIDANANVSLSNSIGADIFIVADAFANGAGNARATAVIGSQDGFENRGGIFQSAFANGTTTLLHENGGSNIAEEADANVSLVNSGSIFIAASAKAVGGDILFLDGPDGFPRTYGDAYADAYVQFGMVQHGTASAFIEDGAEDTVGAAHVDLSFDNSGSIAIAALADASAANAGAHAEMYAGIFQVAYAEAGSPASASVDLVNTGDIDILANAFAHGDAVGGGAAFAAAYAMIYVGIYQSAIATSTDEDATVDVNLSNTSNINIVANAHALGGALDVVGILSTAAVSSPAAYAEAYIGYGIYQRAYGFAFELTSETGEAGADDTYDTTYFGTVAITETLDNSGSITVAAVANATGAFASAEAFIFDVGVYQQAYAYAGLDANATVSLTNDGDILILASAKADGSAAEFSSETGARAYAKIYAGIVQLAARGDLDLNIQNLDQQVDPGIRSGAGSASIDMSLVNNGDITVLATAEAAAFGTWPVFGTALNDEAFAAAYVHAGIVQAAYAEAYGEEFAVGDNDGDPDVNEFTYSGTARATVDLTNNGSISIGAVANASGSEAFAEAYVGVGIFQGAGAKAAEAADAAVTLSNSGDILIFAHANATDANAYVGTSNADGAAAFAYVDNGIIQGAFASAHAGDSVLVTEALSQSGEVFASYEDSPGGPANASVELVNTGNIVINANAQGNGVEHGFAYAYIGVGIGQGVVATYGTEGTASVDLDNDGLISIGATATARGTEFAQAYAIISNVGIGQYVAGVDAADASITNSASAAILITAHAEIDQVEPHFAWAQAYIGVGISQRAVTAEGAGGAASADILNDGLILIKADAKGANASEGGGYAFAYIGTAIAQYASGEAADVSLTNNGTISIIADVVSATGDDDGIGFAQISEVLDQAAFGNSGSVSAELINDGSFLVLATATGLGGDTISFDAFVGDISQVAGAGDAGTARANLVNNGSLIMVANAVGIGGGDGFGDADARGVYQLAYAGGGASATLINTADYLVSANASISVGNLPQKGADAFAYASAAGLYQAAYATISEDTNTIEHPSFTAAAEGSDHILETAITYTFNGSWDNSGPALVVLDNTGSFSVVAKAWALGDDAALADANARGVYQFAYGDPATASIDNSGSMLFSAAAAAFGDEYAFAYAYADGLNQVVGAGSFTNEALEIGTGDLHNEPHGPEDSQFFTRVTEFTQNTETAVSGHFAAGGAATALIVNTGSIAVIAIAKAELGAGNVNEPAHAVADADADGFDQAVIGNPALASVDNSGSLLVLANAAALATGTGATAYAEASGIYQVVLDYAESYAGKLVTVTHLGLNGHSFSSEVFSGTTQYTPTGSARAVVDNSGSIVVMANARAEGTEAFAHADAYGIYQSVSGAPAEALVDNSGSLIVRAESDAIAHGGAATALAHATGIYQRATAVHYLTAYAVTKTTGSGGTLTTYSSEPEGFASASVINSGSLTVIALADAIGGTFAAASADADGVYQSVAGTDWQATFINTGDVNVLAQAHATAAEGGTANAAAYATGYELVASGGSMQWSNTEDYTVNALAVINGDFGEAFAQAVGIDATVLAVGDPTPVGGGLNGTIDNSGPFRVTARAQGGAADTAIATGIEMGSGYNNVEVTNTSTFVVFAITGPGGSATATGLRAFDNGETTAAPTDRLIINNQNGATWMAAFSNTLGATWKRGMAIDVSDAPNNTTINLLGDNSVYGNIDLQAGDLIVVDDTLADATTDTTTFDGIINPEFHPQPGVPRDGTQGVDPSPTFDGTLQINTGGRLLMVDDPTANNFYDGPSVAYVNNFTMQDGATYAIEVRTAGDDVLAEAHYPQIFANTANVDGTLELVVNNQAVTGPLLYDDEVLYDNVIEADTLNGRFDNLKFTPPGFLINASIRYPDSTPTAGPANVDVAITRTPFDVGCLGLDHTFNQCSTAGGIENVYSVNLTAPFANVVAALFTLTPAGYLDALDQLSAAQYASYLQGLRNSQFTLNTNVSDQIDCAVKLSDVKKCEDHTGRFWVEGAYNWSKVDGDREAGQYKAKGWTGTIGADYTWSNFTLGAFAGYRDLDFNMDWYNGDMSATGWHLGLYAQYDTGQFYIRGIGSYSALDGDSRRSVNFANIIGTIDGDPDTNIWSFYGEAGARFDLGGSWLTPFAAVDYTDIKLKSFTETGLPGANLRADSESESQTSTLLGLKWAGQFGGIVPEAKVAWRHDFGDKVFMWTPEFADAPPGSEHDIISQAVKKDKLLVGLALNAALGKDVSGRLGYQGQFNGDINEHKVFGSLTFHFGGKAPPPPPPPPPPPEPPAPPPPPPPAVTPGPFIVFFDWDKDEITPQAAAILDNAAAAYQQTGTAQVMLAGNADRSGSDQYNVGLSQRRASNVKSYLAGRGVPDGVMTTEAFGESRPLVETADGVREPQNRNVQITFGPGSGQ